MKAMFNLPKDINHQCVIVINDVPMIAFIREMTLDPAMVSALNPSECLKKSPPDVIVRFKILEQYNPSEEQYGTFVKPQELQE